MVASSEQRRAQLWVSKQAPPNARTSQPGAPLNRDVSAEVMKIPDPIIEPITIIVASTGPSARTRTVFCGDGPPSGRTARSFRREGAPAPMSGRTFSIRKSNHESFRGTATDQWSRQGPPEPRFAQRNAILRNRFRWIADIDRNNPSARWANRWEAPPRFVES